MVWELPLTSIYWSALNLAGCWAREAGFFRFGNVWVNVFDTYMSMVIGSPCPCKDLMLLLSGDPRNSSRRYRGGETAKRGDYHKVVWRCRQCFCVRKYKGGPNSVSKNHISFRCQKRTQKLVPFTCLSRSWESSPFCYVDERGPVSKACNRCASRLGEAARPGRGNASDAKRIGTRTKRGSRGLETI